MKPILILSILYCALVNLANAQTSYALWFQHLDTKQGLSDNSNLHVYRDSEDFVWISSMTGLNRFDGMQVKNYDAILGDSTSLFGENIQSNFFEDSEQNIWFCTYQAIHYYNRKQDNFSHYFINDANGNPITSDYKVFYLEQDSLLWLKAGEQGNVYTFNIKTKKSQSQIGRFGADRCKVITDKKGKVKYLYGEGGQKNREYQYWKIENSTKANEIEWFEKIDIIKRPSHIYQVYPDENDSYWLATEKGIMFWDKQATTLTAYPTELELKGAHEIIVQDADHFLVLLRKKAIYRFNKKEKTFAALDIRFLDEKNTPKYFEKLYLDKDQNLWISTRGDGVYISNLHQNKFQSIPNKELSPDEKKIVYQAFAEDKAGHFWYGTKENGLFLLEKETNTVRKIDAPLPSPYISKLLKDRDDDIWIGTMYGLAHYNAETKQFKTILSKEGKPIKKRILDIYQLPSNGDILVSILGRGVFILKQNGKQYYLQKVLTGIGYIPIFQDNQQHIYLGNNEENIEVFDLKKDTLMLLEQLAIPQAINAFTQKSDQEIWIATGYGIAKINSDNLQAPPKMLTEKDGLPDKHINCLLSDNQENIWACTSKGLARISSDQPIKTYSLADGMQSSSFNISYKRKNGELWFGGTEGITIASNFKSKRSDVLAQPTITGIKINDENIKATDAQLYVSDEHTSNVSLIKKITLPFNKNTFSFEFVNKEYSNPKNNHIRYKLKGIDDDWVEIKKGEVGFARYANVDYGNYTFLLEGINGDGLSSGKKEVLSLKIKPPFHKTWSFIIGVSLLSIFLIGLLIRYRISQIREREILNTRIAENKMSALRSQMNPHFIFNSLQTVNGFIVRKDIRAAIQYVNQFSRLMRTILENSREGMIPLEKEIELLELYMKIERERFTTPFEYSISVTDDLDIYNVEVPSMLLQPFVENAIKHGLFHQKGQGQLSISFLNKNNTLLCTIIDNGIGREKSNVLNQQRGRSHQSRGLQIVDERLNLIRKSHPGDYAVQIHDLFDTQGFSIGTKVEISLPLSN